MRTFRHWTPRYLFNRMVEKIYRRRRPDLPWLTPTANEILETYLTKTDKGLEFGSGKSTIWFARRIAALTSVEHNPVWYQKVTGMLSERKINNVKYLLHEKGVEDEQGLEAAYVRAAVEIEDESLDFVLIDGIYRDACALTSINKLKPGGVMVIDNANLYLPCLSKAPNSRSTQDGPATQGWSQYYNMVKDWRSIWTGNGVSDTAFYFKGN